MNDVILQKVKYFLKMAPERDFQVIKFFGAVSRKGLNFRGPIIRQYFWLKDI